MLIDATSTTPTRHGLTSRYRCILHFHIFNEPAVVLPLVVFDDIDKSLEVSVDYF